MSEFITLKQLVDPENRSIEDGIVSRCVMHCMGKLPEMKEFADEVRAKGGVEILFTINGREVSLKRFLEEFERQHSWIVAKHAERLLDERLGKILDFAHEMDKEIRNKFRRAFGRDLGDFE
ncbi:MAG TPA: hypothetical protein VFA98_12675 [Thermoanaerobaculia bacterium]|jgi:hypothetical protein|nr:hypothetical protein [Thermoanaerobaculia bacterium]